MPPVPLWRSRTTATATRGLSTGAKAMNHVVFVPCDAGLGGSGLAGDRDPRRSAPRCPFRRSRRSSIISPPRRALFGLDCAPERARASCRRRSAVRGDHALDDVRPHDDAAVRDRRRDHRHLQRRQPGLPSPAPDRTRAARGRPGSRPSGRRASPCCCRGRWSRARSPASPAAARSRSRSASSCPRCGFRRSPCPMLQKTELIEFCIAWTRLTVPNGGTCRSCSTRLAVLDAVARVVEGRLGRELARVEGGRRRHDLEGRAGGVEARCGAVQERRTAEPRLSTPPRSCPRSGSGRRSGWTR